MSENLNFFIECDPVVMDCWITDGVSRKRLRKATVEEMALWEQLQRSVAEVQMQKYVIHDLLAKYEG